MEKRHFKLAHLKYEKREEPAWAGTELIRGVRDVLDKYANLQGVLWKTSTPILSNKIGLNMEQEKKKFIVLLLKKTKVPF